MVSSRIIAAPDPELGQPITAVHDSAETTVAERVRESIAIASALAPRSLQRSIGPSEIGVTCARALAYRLAGTVPTGKSKSDPMAALVGTGAHLIMAESFRRLRGRSGRFLIEHQVTYRGITGSVDLFDRRHHLAIDWKSTTKSKIKRVAREGPPARYLVQAMTYAAGLIESGETVDDIAIVYVPVDGGLADVHAIVRPFDRSIADDAIDRYESLQKEVAEHGPAAVHARTSNLCAWCDFFQPGRAADANGCPGNSPIPQEDPSTRKDSTS